MAPSKPLGFSLSPFWPHYAGSAAILFGVLAGLVRFLLLDRSDPFHCDALLNEGTWSDSSHRNWQPEGCMMHMYQPKDASACLSSQRVVFIGDSVTRKLFFQFANILDPKLPTAPQDDDLKHTDHSLRSYAGTQIEFFWDPFLNSSNVQNTIIPQVVEGSHDMRDPAFLVLGSGLWYLRYANISGGLPAWEANIEALLESLTLGHSKPADEVVILPIEEVVPSKLSRERASTMHASDIDAMNSDLYHRIHPPPADSLSLFAGGAPRTLPISLPLVFNRMLDPSQTEDGLHFADAVINVQANLLLNLRCNDMLPKKFPMDKTCCRSYPRPYALQMIILGVVVLWGPCTWLLSRQLGQRGPGGSLIREGQLPALVASAAATLIFAADRTGFWLKEQKQFSAWTFAFLSLTALAVGLGSVKRADKDLGFLNREQTDEWKGWMQIAILIYHYLGASKISGIYNPIRVLVAAYLFMTGYGHTMYYIKKVDFGFLRVAQVMVRLNLLTLLLAYIMDTDYISYYFAPLVSMWYLIIYCTMAVGAQFNDRTPFLVSKIILSLCLVTWFMRAEPWLLETLFAFLERVFAIRWSAREWAFRVTLDLYIVYFGMFVSLGVIKIREHRLTEHPHWPLAVKLAMTVSVVTMIWFFVFELLQESKFTYNTYHPYISFLPISAFVILRNANPILRSASSRVFAFIGRCSLETFIIQYHLWLAADTKGVLVVIPGASWRPVNFVITTMMFVYLSHQVAQATGEITKWICGSDVPKGLPNTVNRRSGGEESIPLTSTSQQDEWQSQVRKDQELEGNLLPPEPDTPIRPSRRWVDRLAETSSQRADPGFRLWYGEKEWKPGVGMKIALGLGAMWVVNVMWPYP